MGTPEKIDAMKLRAYNLLLVDETKEMSILLNDVVVAPGDQSNPQRLANRAGTYITQIINQKENLQIALELVCEAKEESNMPFRKVEL